MKNRFLLITLAILSMGLFVTSNVRAQDGPEAPPQAQPAGTTSGSASSTDDGGAHQRDSWERYNHATVMRENGRRPR